MSIGKAWRTGELEYLPGNKTKQSKKLLKDKTKIVEPKPAYLPEVKE